MFGSLFWWDSMQIDREQVIRALSDTVDLVGIDEVQHCKRVAYIALICA